MKNVSIAKCELDVFECDCGFHIGLDATYIEQVEEIEIECPSCKLLLKTAEAK